MTRLAAISGMLAAPFYLTLIVATALLLIGGAGMIGAGAFPCNEGCRNILAEPDLVGRMHIVASLLAGLGTGVALCFFWAAMRKTPIWAKSAGLTFAAAVCANLPGIAFWLTLATGYRLRSVEGLVQRVGFVVVLLWVFVIATRLISKAEQSRAEQSRAEHRGTEQIG